MSHEVKSRLIGLKFLIEYQLAIRPLHFVWFQPSFTERWPSGLRRSTGNAVYRKVPWVQIPPSPPFDVPTEALLIATGLEKEHGLMDVVWRPLLAFPVA